MKVRISDETLTFRLNDEDLESLAVHHSLKQKLDLTPTTSLTFRLTAKPLAQDFELLHTPDQVEVQVSENYLKLWKPGAQFEWHRGLKNPDIRIKIEKDLKPRRSQSDASKGKEGRHEQKA